MASLSLHSSSWFSSLRIKPKTLKSTKLCCVVSSNNNEESSSEANSVEVEKTSAVDPIKLAFNKAKAYKDSSKSNSGLGIEKNGAEGDNSVKESNVVGDGGKKDLPVSVKIAMEKAKKYKQNKGVAVSEIDQGLQGGSESTWGENVNDNSVGKKGELSVSKIDFVGLGFSDNKKTRGLPPGLVPFSDSFSDGDVPEVELIVGDANNFEATTAPQLEQTKEDESELYKPKVSTWGVFPRPNNISKTFGGGRVIRPGEILETEEEKATKEARTKQMLAAYKKKYGLSIDPKLKAECQEALKDGDLLMDAGKLKDALPYYEKVIDKLPFKVMHDIYSSRKTRKSYIWKSICMRVNMSVQSELHGLAALQWSICQDSLSRTNEARSMYEKLQSHPNVKVGKRARQFMYSFQAMEMMKVRTGSSRYKKNTFYQSYFDAFIEKKSNYPLKDDVAKQSEMNQVLLYIVFLISPIFVVLLLAVQKRI